MNCLNNQTIFLLAQIMSADGGSPVFILYKVVNSDTDAGDAYFNAFPFHGGRPTLATVKQYVEWSCVDFFHSLFSSYKLTVGIDLEIALLCTA
jgi:hypothetical protein